MLRRRINLKGLAQCPAIPPHPLIGDQSIDTVGSRQLTKRAVMSAVEGDWISNCECPRTATSSIIALGPVAVILLDQQPFRFIEILTRQGAGDMPVLECVLAPLTNGSVQCITSSIASGGEMSCPPGCNAPVSNDTDILLARDGVGHEVGVEKRTPTILRCPSNSTVSFVLLRTNGIFLRTYERGDTVREREEDRAG